MIDNQVKSNVNHLYFEKNEGETMSEQVEKMTINEMKNPNEEGVMPDAEMDMLGVGEMDAMPDEEMDMLGVGEMDVMPDAEMDMSSVGEMDVMPDAEMDMSGVGEMDVMPDEEMAMSGKKPAIEFPGTWKLMLSQTSL